MKNDEQRPHQAFCNLILLLFRLKDSDYCIEPVTVNVTRVRPGVYLRGRSKYNLEVNTASPTTDGKLANVGCRFKAKVDGITTLNPKANA